MINVSEDFLTAIGLPERKTASKIIFEILDVDAYTDADATVTSEAEISKKDQLYDKNREMTEKYATLENNFFRLNGSFMFPPDSPETEHEVGWWSNELCGEDGIFGTDQIITTQFSADQSSIGITVTFDTLADEYASDFTIQVYNSLNALIHTEEVTNNSESVYVLEQTLEDYRKIIITITKWGVGFRRARITEIDFGVVKIYTNAQIIDETILEELDTTSNTLSSNELNITLDNYDKTFNILNPAGIYQALQKNQQIYSYIGVEKTNGDVEYVSTGIFYLSDWKSDEGTLTATFTARDILNVISQSEFSGGSYTDETLYDIAAAVLDSAGVTNYTIDVALNSIIVSGVIDRMDHRSALQLIAIAGMAAVYSDRSGRFIIKQLGDAYLSQSIDKDNMYKTPQITLDSLINTVVIQNAITSYTYVDPLKPVNEQTFSITISNSLITDETHAESVAEWILSEYKKRYLYEINWRQNPALECGDIVTVQDEYGQNYNVRIIKNEFNFSGYLKGRTNAKGGGS